MCRVLIVPHIPKGKEEQVQKLFIAAKAPFSVNNSDGLGYALMRENGTIFGERWRFNDDAFKNRTVYRSNPKQENAQNRLVNKYGDRVKFDPKPEVYNQFGTKAQAGDRAVAAFMHTRFATCDKNLKNVHPFYRKSLYSTDGLVLHDDIVLIHNGVIRNNEKWKDQCESTNDSEAILANYIQHQVHYTPDSMQEMVKELNGYYVFSVMSADFQNNLFVDIVKDKQARLHVAFIEQLGAEVFCTEFEMLEEAVSKLKWTISAHSPVENNTFIRFDPLTGEPVRVESIDCEYDWRSNSSYGSGYSGYHGGHRSFKDEDDQTKVEEKRSLPAPKDDKKSDDFVGPVSNEKMAKLISLAYKKNKNEVDEAEMNRLLENMPETDFENYIQFRSRMQEEDFSSDDPSKIAEWLKGIKEA